MTLYAFYESSNMEDGEKKWHRLNINPKLTSFSCFLLKNILNLNHICDDCNVMAGSPMLLPRQI